MPDSIQIADFDIALKQVVLVHRNTFVPHFSWQEYRTGRAIDGFVYCVSGRAGYDYGDRHFSLLPGQMLFLPASSRYTVCCEGDEPFVHYTVNFQLEDIPSAQDAHTALTAILSGKLLHVTSTDSAYLYAKPLERLLSLWQNKGNGYRVMAKALVYELLYDYFTDAGHVLSNHADYVKLLPARRALDDHFAQEWTTADLSALCNISETHFRRLFRQVFGCTPTAYRLRRRIDKAKDYLLSGQYTVEQTAFAVGFSDPNYFARVFRAQVGTSPSTYKYAQ